MGAGRGIKYSQDAGTTSPPESSARPTPVLCLFVLFITIHFDKCAFQRMRRAWRSAWREGQLKPLPLPPPPLDELHLHLCSCIFTTSHCGSRKQLKAVHPDLLDHSMASSVFQWKALWRNDCSGISVRLSFILQNHAVTTGEKRWAGLPLLRHAADADADTSLFSYRRNGWVTFCHLIVHVWISVTSLISNYGPCWKQDEIGEQLTSVAHRWWQKRA